MANWTPSGFIGQMFKLIGSFVPPPAIMPSPLLWGDQTQLRARLGAGLAELSAEPRLIDFVFDGLTPPAVVAFWRRFYGPTQRAFEALQADAGKQTALREALERLWSDANSAGAGNTRVESEYLEVVAIRA